MTEKEKEKEEGKENNSRIFKVVNKLDNVYTGGCVLYSDTLKLSQEQDEHEQQPEQEAESGFLICSFSEEIKIIGSSNGNVLRTLPGVSHSYSCISS
jgi:hypothetical protein